MIRVWLQFGREPPRNPLMLVSCCWGYQHEGAPVALPTSSTAQFKRFFDSGLAVRCLLPLGVGRFMHLVVLHGCQGADSDAEQFALTEQLFDAALGELGVVARGQPCLIVVDFNAEHTKIPCLA